MDVQQYVIDGLRAHKTVGVLGLGTFFVEHVGAVVSAGQISPPTYNVTFERKLAETEHIVNAIAASEGCSPAVAKEEIYRYSNSLLSWLQEHQTYSLGAFGSFSLKNGKLEFTPSSHGTGFGLPRQVNVPVKDTAPAPALPELIVEPAQLEATPTEPQVQPIIDNTNGPLEHTNDIPANVVREIPSTPKARWLWPVITAAVILAGLIAYSLWPRNTSQVQTPVVADTATGRQNNIVPADTTGKVGAANTADSGRKVAALKPEDSARKVAALKPADSVSDTTKIASPVARPLAKYAIIGAAIQSKPKTLRFIHSMKKLGLPAEINTHMPGRLYKVSLGFYPTRSAAQADLPRIKALTKIKGLYVYPLK